MKLIKAFALLGLMLIPFSVNSQNRAKEERKELRKLEQEANFNILDSLLNAKSFVLEADFLQNTYGVRIPVLSSLNFIRVDKNIGVLQTGSPMRIGYNTVGGVTASGSVESWVLKKDTKRQVLTVQFGLFTNLGHYDVILNVDSENHATATISGLMPGRLTWEGNIETLDNSRVFKGQDTY